MTAFDANAGTLAYPSPDKPLFLVDHPDGWEVKPPSERGDYADFNGPTGITIQVRSLVGRSRDDLERAIDAEGFPKVAAMCFFALDYETLAEACVSAAQDEMAVMQAGTDWCFRCASPEDRNSELCGRDRGIAVASKS